MQANIEALLFVTNRPMSMKKIAEIVGGDIEEVRGVVAKLAKKYSSAESGLRLLQQGDDVQLATSPECSELVQQFLKEETTGELTKASLETLTIIAYRGPLTKAELEQIRGVNCTIILRNLMMRGLVESKGDAKDVLATYSVTTEFVRFLGVSAVGDLPDYARLRSHDSIVSVLKKSHDV